jgi:hypothetical protein
MQKMIIIASNKVFDLMPVQSVNNQVQGDF